MLNLDSSSDYGRQIVSCRSGVIQRYIHLYIFVQKAAMPAHIRFMFFKQCLSNLCHRRHLLAVTTFSRRELTSTEDKPAFQLALECCPRLRVLALLPSTTTMQQIQIIGCRCPRDLRQGCCQVIDSCVSSV